MQKLFVVTETRTCIIAAPTHAAALAIFPACVNDAKIEVSVKRAVRPHLQDKSIPIFTKKGQVPHK